MTTTSTPRELPPGLDAWPPTQDDLPYEDGEMAESNIHLLNPVLLMQALQRFLAGVRDAFVGANMFVYFSPDQVKTHGFRGPDFFVVLGAKQGARKSWVVWQEDGRAPDVVIEMLSDSTEYVDKSEKLRVYQDQLRVPEYFWFHPWNFEVGGVRLVSGVYQPIASEPDGSLMCESLGLKLVVWEGTYEGLQSRWLRWMTLEGELLPTPHEVAAEAQSREDQQRARADAAEREIERLRQLLAERETPEAVDA
jgi:Uma2 family endonuclease